jgi:hypothetical protein
VVAVAAAMAVVAVAVMVLTGCVKGTDGMVSARVRVRQVRAPAPGVLMRTHPLLPLLVTLLVIGAIQNRILCTCARGRDAHPRLLCGNQQQQQQQQQQHLCARRTKRWWWRPPHRCRCPPPLLLRRRRCREPAGTGALPPRPASQHLAPAARWHLVAPPASRHLVAPPAPRTRY